MSYVSEVVDHITTLSAPDQILSADDYCAIAEWEKQEIPLGFVLSLLDRQLLDGAAMHEHPLSQMRTTMCMEFANWLNEQRSGVDH